MEGNMEDKQCCKTIPLHEDINASRWAKEFIATIHKNQSLEVDVDLMLAWFANAMCAQMDFDTRRQEEKDANRFDYVLTTHSGEVVAVYSELPCKSICDRDYSLHLEQDLQMLGNSDIPVAGQGSNWNCTLTKIKVNSLNRTKERIEIQYKDE